MPTPEEEFDAAQHVEDEFDSLTGPGSDQQKILSASTNPDFRIGHGEEMPVQSIEGGQPDAVGEVSRGIAGQRSPSWFHNLLGVDPNKVDNRKMSETVDPADLQKYTEHMNALASGPGQGFKDLAATTAAMAGGADVGVPGQLALGAVEGATARAADDPNATGEDIGASGAFGGAVRGGLAGLAPLGQKLINKGNANLVRRTLSPAEIGRLRAFGPEKLAETGAKMRAAGLDRGRDLIQKLTPTDASRVADNAADITSQQEGNVEQLRQKLLGTNGLGEAELDTSPIVDKLRNYTRPDSAETSTPRIARAMERQAQRLESPPEDVQVQGSAQQPPPLPNFSQPEPPPGYTPPAPQQTELPLPPAPPAAAQTPPEQLSLDLSAPPASQHWMDAPGLSHVSESAVRAPGDNEAVVRHYVTPDGPKQAVWKPASGAEGHKLLGIEPGSVPQREQTAYELSKVLNPEAPVVPKTVAREGGSLQEFVHAPSTYDIDSAVAADPTKFANSPSQTQTFLLDLLARNPDRHGGNVLWSGAESVTPQAHAIDNGLAFGGGTQSSAPMRIPFDEPAFQQALLSAPEAQRAALQKISARQVADVLGKADQIPLAQRRDVLGRLRDLQYTPEQLKGMSPEELTRWVAKTPEQRGLSGPDLNQIDELLGNKTAPSPVAPPPPSVSPSSEQLPLDLSTQMPLNLPPGGKIARGEFPAGGTTKEFEAPAQVYKPYTMNRAAADIKDIGNQLFDKKQRALKPNYGEDKAREISWRGLRDRFQEEIDKSADPAKAAELRKASKDFNISADVQADAAGRAEKDLRRSSRLIQGGAEQLRDATPGTQYNLGRLLQKAAGAAPFSEGLHLPASGQPAIGQAAERGLGGPAMSQEQRKEAEQKANSDMKSKMYAPWYNTLVGKGQGQ